MQEETNVTVHTGTTKTQTYYTVVFEKPSKITGKMLREVSDYVGDLSWFRAHIEKCGGKVISESGPRQVESIPVYF